MITANVGETVTTELVLLDASGEPLTGQAAGSFSTTLLLDGAVDGQSVDIDEVGSTGIYSVSFEPDAPGRWYLVVEHGGLRFDESFEVGLDVKVHCAVVDDGTTVHMRGWITRNGRRVESPTSGAFTIYDEVGDQIATVNDATPDAQGFFVGTASVVGGVVNNRTYGVVATVVDAGASYTSATALISVSA